MPFQTTYPLTFPASVSSSGGKGRTSHAAKKITLIRTFSRKSSAVLSSKGQSNKDVDDPSHCESSALKAVTVTETSQRLLTRKVRFQLQLSASWASEENLAFFAFALGCGEEQIARCLRDGKGGAGCCTCFWYFSFRVSLKIESQDNKLSKLNIILYIMWNRAMPHPPKSVKALWSAPQFLQLWNDTNIKQHRCCKTLTFGNLSILQMLQILVRSNIFKENECNN